MLKRTYTLTVHITKPDSHGPYKTDTVQADDIVQLVTQFSLLATRLHREVNEEEIAEFSQRNDDEIPF